MERPLLGVTVFFRFKTKRLEGLVNPVSGPVTKQIRKEGGAKTNEKKEGNIDKPLNQAGLKVLIRKEEEVGQSQNRRDREVKNAATDKGSKKAVRRVACICFVREAKEASEPLANRGKGHEEANQHRDDKGDRKVNGKIAPINLRRRKPRPRE
jgi:hypothetical protein